MNSGKTNVPTVMRVRVIWGAMLMGQVVFFVVILMLSRNAGGGVATVDEKTLRTMFRVSLVMLATAAPVGFVMRRIIFSQGTREDGLIARDKYATGTIMFLALMEGVGMFSLVLVLIGRERMPYVAVAAAAFLLQVASFPAVGNVESDRE